MYQDGLEVFTFNFTDVEEGPMLPNTFDHVKLGRNFRGLITDVQIYDTYFSKYKMQSWTTECKGGGGNIFTWAADKVDITQAYTSAAVKVSNTETNATFVSMNKNEICPDQTKPIKMKKQVISAK